MPSTSTTTTNKAISDPQHTKDTASSVVKQESISAPSDPPADDSIKDPENLLKEYSKELYVYTLDLLNSVRIDNAHKGANGKAYLLKRTISDIAVPLKTMGLTSDTPKASKGTAAQA